ncbi:hypothetical protein A6V39_01210 [Candidatus Mycoplasma haematobovis]|uniref:DUF31 domain-containing protein n=1 Tax=Candidatus Mycoplasma haematobovis TaxID=432608 RepID=A0A1A9QDJ6_9MOLU|nr:hypothetical protein [Candidatus Mycoplasma haematobovis]OAL10672.1 hypothetical protein A6V39_01210 [Candidatus Mycoplasma haematobovis]
MNNKVISSILGVGVLIGGWYLYPNNSILEPEFQNVFGENKAFFQNSFDTDIEEKVANIALVNDGEAGRKAIERIDNHTFKFLTSCDVGTGWVLDYLVPENGGYPTTWFFATNAHVIQNFQFSSNPYEQELPISLDAVKSLRNKHTKTNSKLFDTNACNESKRTGYSGFNLATGDTGSTNERDKDGISSSGMKEPKLFYIPINFLGKSGRKWEAPGNADYYKDFAVIEIEFESVEAAKAATNGFYDKYKPSTDEGLDLSKDELMSQYDLNELALLNTNFYSLGYPDLENQGQRFAKRDNLDKITGSASLISFGIEGTPLIGNNNKLPIKGHISANGREIQNPNSALIWNGKKMYSIGYEYLISNMSMGSGASGSLVTDKDGNVLGIYSNHYAAINHGVVVPLRSSGIKDIQPQYDLIRGANGQKSSFRQQIEKYYKGRNTYLKSKGWK